MRRNAIRLWARRTVGLALLAAGAAGCNSIDREPRETFLGKASLKHYKAEATRVDYPTRVEGDVTQALSSDEPRVVGDHRKDEVWDLTLTEALHCALTNSKIIRTRVQRGQVVGLGSLANTLANPNNLPSVYDPAIQETGVLFGGRGVEAALADFDAQFTTSMVWGRNAAYSNGLLGTGGINGTIPGAGTTGTTTGSSGTGTSGTGTVTGTGTTGGVGSAIPGFVSTQETGVFQSGISKQFATGGSVNVFHNWNYLGTNSPGVLFPSSYTGATGVSFRQPLLAGAGVDFTRIAGPINPNFGNITGVTQGVLIARINNDITIADFEISVRNLLKQVEDTYWDLYFAYRAYDSAVTARNSALRSWREARARLEIGGVAGFRPADEAQARDRYFETRAQVETALNQIHLTEGELRRLMSLPPNDGRIIRPVEEPTTARLLPDWHASLADAMMFRTELRRQKWNIKSLELQLLAANNLTRPRLDFVSQYQVNGFGDDLLSQSDNDGVTSQGLRSAYGTLLQGDQTGWNLGLQFSMPIGFRQAKTQVRNIELRLAKAREVLNAQELDIAHEVGDALQAVEYNYRNAETNFNRRAAAARRVELFEQELQAGTVTLDEVLRAQASLATAEVQYFQSVVQYNQALSLLHFTKGTLLGRDNVALEEGAWTPRAYDQALRRAWERSHAFPNPLLHTEPPPFAIPESSRQLVCPPDASVPPGTMPPAPDAVPVPPAPPAGPPVRAGETPKADPPAPTTPPANTIPYEPTKGGNAFPPPAPPAAARLESAGVRDVTDVGPNPFEEERFRLPVRVATPGATAYREFASVPAESRAVTTADLSARQGDERGTAVLPAGNEVGEAAALPFLDPAAP